MRTVSAKQRVQPPVARTLAALGPALSRAIPLPRQTRPSPCAQTPSSCIQMQSWVLRLVSMVPPTLTWLDSGHLRRDQPSHRRDSQEVGRRKVSYLCGHFMMRPTLHARSANPRSPSPLPSHAPLPTSLTCPLRTFKACLALATPAISDHCTPGLWSSTSLSMTWRYLSSAAVSYDVAARQTWPRIRLAATLQQPKAGSIKPGSNMPRRPAVRYTTS